MSEQQKTASYKAVPDEPTAEMLEAGHRAAWQSVPSLFDRDDVANVYRAMLAAAPTALLQELIDTPEPEPFGYFKAEPFGWTDCSETDEGAIALYSAPPANNQSEQHLEMVNAPSPSVPDADLVRDAERYRWLRDKCQRHGGGLTIAKTTEWDLSPWSGDDPDREIDAAIEREKKGGAA